MKALTEFLRDVGEATFFLFAVIAALPGALLRPRLLVQQLYMIGMLSLIIIAVSGSFIGMVLALQGYRTLATFGAASSLGLVVAFSVIRELGPVVTALLYAGRAGLALAAEDTLRGVGNVVVDDPYLRARPVCDEPGVILRYAGRECEGASTAAVADAYDGAAAHGDSCR